MCWQSQYLNPYPGVLCLLSPDCNFLHSFLAPSSLAPQDLKLKVVLTLAASYGHLGYVIGSPALAAGKLVPERARE